MQSRQIVVENNQPEYRNEIAQTVICGADFFETGID